MKSTMMLLSLLVFSMTARAQTAKVIELNSADAQEAKAKWEALQHAQEYWKSFEDRIKKDYTTVKDGDPDAGNIGVNTSANLLTSGCGIVITTIPPSYEENKDCLKRQEEERKKRPVTMMLRKGWEGDFEFDKSFKFIVPKRAETTGVITINGGTWPCGTYLTPSYYDVPPTSSALPNMHDTYYDYLRDWRNAGIRYESITPPNFTIFH